jgi:hypothetical protein
MRPKFTYTRSKKLMEAYRAIPCQHCGRDDGTVCGAHSNQSRHGKGRGIKASDIYCASLCSRCHSAIDQGRSLSQDDREAIWEKAHEQTWKELVIGGLWPVDIPLPDSNLLLT